MRHGALVFWEIEFAKIPTRHSAGNDSHVKTRADLGEEQLMGVQPGKPGRVAEEKMGVASQNGDRVGVPRGG